MLVQPGGLSHHRPPLRLKLTAEPTEAEARDSFSFSRGFQSTYDTIRSGLSLGARTGSSILTNAGAVLASTTSSVVSMLGLGSLVIPPLGMVVLPHILDQLPSKLDTIGAHVGHRTGQGLGGAAGLIVGSPISAVVGARSAFVEPEVQDLDLTPRQEQALTASDYPVEPQEVGLWNEHQQKRSLNRLAALGLGVAAGACIGCYGGWAGGVTGLLLGGSLSGAIRQRVPKHPRLTGVLGAVLTGVAAWAGATQNGWLTGLIGAGVGVAAFVALSDRAFETAEGDGEELRLKSLSHLKAVRAWEKLNPLTLDREVEFAEDEIQIGDIPLEVNWD